MSTRTISAALSTALQADRVSPLLLVEALFDSGALRIWNGVGDLSALSETWTGTGLMLSISAVEETAEIRATGVNISLTGIPSSIISIALSEDYQGRLASVYIGAFDVSTGAVITDPILAFKGNIDMMPMEERGETAKIVLTVESRLVQLEKASRRRFTAQDQKVEFPLDTGFDHVASIQDAQIVWGVASPQLTTVSSGSSVPVWDRG